MVFAARLRTGTRGHGGEDGLALVAVLMAISLLAGLGAALVLTTTQESQVAANYRDGVEALYAADAALERALSDVAGAVDWDALLDGTVRSSFVDGAPGGPRAVPGGATLDLTAETNVMRCGHPAACTDAEMDGVDEERPWGVDNPRWQLYAYGPIADLAPGIVDSRFYVIAWVADDPADDDGEPLRDGGAAAASRPAPNPGAGMMVIRARSYGVDGVGRSVEGTVARGARGIRLVSWRRVE